MREYFVNIYHAMATILIGMRITWGHLFTRSVTKLYPHVKPELPERTRMKLDVAIEDCIGCMACVRACPVDCITIETVKASKEEDLGETSNGTKKRLRVVQFDIDMGKCCYCSDCVFPCPTGCIHMTPEYEFSTYDRNDFLFTYANYPPEKVTELQERARVEKEAADAARAAKIKAAEEAKKAADDKPAATE